LIEDVLGIEYRNASLSGQRNEEFLATRCADSFAIARKVPVTMSCGRIAASGVVDGAV